MTAARTEDDAWFLACSLDDVTVRFCRSQNAAESVMEAPDIDSWRVFDAGLFVRELKVVSGRWGRWVSIGARLGNEPAREDALARMRAYLRWVRPEGAWNEAPLDALIEAMEEVDRRAEAVALRRMRIFAVPALVLCLAALWWLSRR